MRKIIIIIISCCTAVLLLGFAGFRGYQAWKEKNWFNMAKDYAAKSDNRSAQLCLQQVLRFNANNLEACRMMATLHESARSPAALMWRERVLEVNPNSLDDRLALAKTALLVGELAVATNALAGVDTPGKKQMAYHNLAGLVALALGQPHEATSHFVEASRLEPWNEMPQVNLAMVRLGGTNPLDTAEARISLTRISLNATNTSLKCLALRELVNDARRSKQHEAALSFSKQLVEQTNSVFQDRLVRLDVLREAKPSEFAPSLAAFQREAGDDEGKVLQLASWQIARLGAPTALSWLSSLPPSTQTNDLVALAIADCKAQLGDWVGLQNSINKQNWGDLDFLRHALLTRALREQGLAGASKAEWVQALETAGKQRARLAKLLEFAAVSKWNAEAEEILWKMVNQFPEDQMAIQGLSRILYERGRTPLLLNLFSLQCKRKPDDLSAKNNLAMTSLLLNAQEFKPHDLAREVYQKSPTNASFASTYAFSLHLQKKDAEALKVMQQLSARDLENPSIAGYYGLILKATGNPTKAVTYLNWANKSTLLPEEKKLFEEAKRGS